MSNLSSELVVAARSIVGAGFEQHYLQTDPCRMGAGAILDSPRCMERGLGQNNRYDCMGLVIASMKLVLGRTDWPVEYRHLEQFSRLAEVRPAEPGDTLVLEDSSGFPAHMGIMTDPSARVYVHATTRAGIYGVAETPVWVDNVYRCISPEDLATIPDLNV